MKAMSNYEKVSAVSERPQLKAGAYICVIKKAKVVSYPKKDNSGMFEKFEIAIDIADGEFKGFFEENFNSQNVEDKKWKGVLRNLYVPLDDGSEQDNYTMAKFKAAMEAIEESNKGFKWEWDENKLSGKKVGVIFRDEEYSFNGYSGWSAKPFKLISVDAVKDGKFKMPAALPLKKDSGLNANSNAFTPVNIENPDDLPF